MAPTCPTRLAVATAANGANVLHNYFERARAQDWFKIEH